MGGREIGGCMIIVGIDPGLDGAIAVLIGDELTIHDVPTLAAGTGGKRVVDHAAFAFIVDVIHKIGAPRLVAIENVAAVKTGMSGAFAYGKGVGILIGTFAAHFAPLRFIQPTAWKRGMRIAAGAGKDASRQRASEIFPRYADLWRRVKDDGRAEAALIAEYARQLVRKEESGQ